jgi:hypothetical protein
MSRPPAADIQLMETALASVIRQPATIHPERAVYAYLRSISPFHNFRRWALAQFAYWGSLLIIGVGMTMVSLLG